MTRSVQRFLSKNKLVAGAGIGAIAMLTIAVPASSQDEVFTLTTAIQVPGAAEFFSFDISWFDPKLNRYFLADRNNKAIDVVDPRDNSITQFFQDFAGFTGDNDTSGPDGVLTANNSTELWVGDSPGRVW